MNIYYYHSLFWCKINGGDNNLLDIHAMQVDPILYQLYQAS